MRPSNAAFLFGTVVGMPAFFVQVSTFPAATQIAWAATVLACGIAGVALWAFEHP